MKTLVKLYLIFLFTVGLLVQITQAQVLQVQPLTTFGTNGIVLPSTNRPYLTDGTTNTSPVHELQRSMAYNPTTGHLLILSRTNIATQASYYIAIIDAVTGADVGSLPLGIPGIGATAGFDYNVITVAADGGIYVGDLTSASQTSGSFNLYYWASESGSMNQVWGGDPSSGNPAGGNDRWGDSMAVTGTGTNTEVLVSSRGNVVAILTPTDPTLTDPWACATISTPVPPGNIGYGLAFGVSNNTFYAQTEGGPLYLFNYTLTNSLAQASAPTPVAAGTATNIYTYPATLFPGWTGAIGIQTNTNLLADLEMPPGLAANVRLYNIANQTNSPVLLDRVAWATNEDGDGIYAGSIIFAGTNLYALVSDNGVMAFRVFSGPQPLLAPAVILEPASATAYFENNATFTGAADGIPAPAYQWYFSPNTIPTTTSNSMTTTLLLTNIAPANLGQYYFVATNSSGSVTSAVATLSQAVAFQNGVVYEPFNYPAGQPLQGFGGWVTNASATAGSQLLCYIAAGNLAAPGLAAPIGNHYLWESNVTVRLPFGTITNGPLYFSFVERASNTLAGASQNPTAEDPIGGLTYFSNTSLYPKIDCCWIDPNDYQIGIAKGSGTTHIFTNTAYTFNASSVVFVVGCFIQTNSSINGALGANIEMWVNPNPTNYGAALPPSPDVFTNAGSGDISTGVDRFSLRGVSQDVQHEIDELRIGYTWAAVTAPLPVYLAASKSGNNVVVSWPTNAVGYTLIGKTSLTSGAWVTNTPITVQGTNNTFTVPSSTGQQFFRLTR